MVATHIKKIKYIVLCMTGVYLRYITNTTVYFALEYESSVSLIFLLIFAHV